MARTILRSERVPLGLRGQTLRLDFMEAKAHAELVRVCVELRVPPDGRITETECFELPVSTLPAVAAALVKLASAPTPIPKARAA